MCDMEWRCCTDMQLMQGGKISGDNADGVEVKKKVDCDRHYGGQTNGTLVNTRLRTGRAKERSARQR